jgi:hypothetical protein
MSGLGHGSGIEAGRHLGRHDQEVPGEAAEGVQAHPRRSRLGRPRSDSDDDSLTTFREAVGHPRLAEGATIPRIQAATDKANEETKTYHLVA